jgi:hypothetical protein
MNVLSLYLRKIVSAEERVRACVDLPTDSILIYTKKYSHFRYYEIYISNYKTYRVYYSGSLCYVAEIDLL